MSGRPDPDALLAQVQAEEARKHRGRLKLFFGAAPGVGKTYAMLNAAQARSREGADVLVGIVETHGRAETARLLDGLPALPRRATDYRGTSLTEFDLDAALGRHPGLLLLDELAHTNAPGSRHDKRWQDVAELLDAGIDVYSTLNVQHVDSLNDVVAQITGVTVRETVPDAMLERADEIEVVDVSPDVLLQRLREGKVYIPEQASRALERFFRRGNLSALRELALRQTASRVDAEVMDYRQAEGITEPWPAGERIAVCIGPDPQSARLVRAAKRMAEGLAGEWTALYVESALHQRLSREDQAAAVMNLRLAEQLGGRTVTLDGEDIAAEILAWARTNNVTKIIVGKPAASRWWRRRLSLLDALIKGSGAIDVYVITGAGATPRGAAPAMPRLTPSDWGLAVGAVAVATFLGLAFRDLLSTTDDAMLYLLGVVLVGARARQRPALLTSVLSIAAFDFCFVPPFYTFAVSDLRYVLTFAMMLAIAVMMARLTGRIREQSLRSRDREQRTAAAYALSRDIAEARDVDAVVLALARHIREGFASSVTVLLPNGAGVFPDDDGVARWVYERRQLAGLGTQTLPATPALYLPLVASEAVLGVVRVVPRDARDAQDPVRRQLLEAFVGQGALALERAQLAARNQASEIEVKTERLRTSLLSSLSHDLRTPLASIEGAASTMLAGSEPPAPERRSLAQTIVRESRRMTRLVANLLDMVRLEAGALNVNKEWQPLEEVVGVALVFLEERLQGHAITTRIPADLPLVPIDGLLIEQVLINLIENAVKYAPAGTPIEIEATGSPATVTVGVADRGPGIPPGEEQRIFEKFHRATEDDSAGGVGLGLTICQGIVAAHGGRMWAENRQGGGAVFRFTLPIEGTPPVLTAEAAAGGAAHG